MLAWGRRGWFGAGGDILGQVGVAQGRRGWLRAQEVGSSSVSRGSAGDEFLAGSTCVPPPPTPHAKGKGAHSLSAAGGLHGVVWMGHGLGCMGREMLQWCWEAAVARTTKPFLTLPGRISSCPAHFGLWGLKWLGEAISQLIGGSAGTCLGSPSSTHPGGPTPHTQELSSWDAGK